MDAYWWIQQVTTRVGAGTCWIQQPVSPKQVVGFNCVFNSEVDQRIRKSLVLIESIEQKLIRVQTFEKSLSKECIGEADGLGFAQRPFYEKA